MTSAQPSAQVRRTSGDFCCALQKTSPGRKVVRTKQYMINIDINDKK